jgi:hypothetical protein
MTKERIKLLIGSVVGAVLIHLAWTALAPSPASAATKCTVTIVPAKLSIAESVPGDAFGVTMKGEQAYVAYKSCSQ